MQVQLLLALPPQTGPISWSLLEACSVASGRHLGEQQRWAASAIKKTMLAQVPMQREQGSWRNSRRR